MLLYVLPSYGQTYDNIISTISENTPDSTVFQHCIDSIAKYVYLDSRKMKPYMDAAEEMLSNESELPNRQRLEYVIQLIYDEYNYNNSLGVFKIIESNREMLKLEGIPQKQKNQFKFLEAYSLLTLGQIDDAQEVFYELLNIATVNKDTSLMIQSLSSLGKLFGEQGDIENAEKYSFQFFELIPENKTTHKATYYSELVQFYIDSELYDKAQHYNQVALQLADSLDLMDLQLDFLLQSVYISLEKDNPALANKSYQEARKVQEILDNPNYLMRCRIAYANILEYKNQ